MDAKTLDQLFQKIALDHLFIGNLSVVIPCPLKTLGSGFWRHRRETRCLGRIFRTVDSQANQPSSAVRADTPALRCIRQHN